MTPDEPSAPPTPPTPDAPSPLHRALRWSLPGAALLSLPFGANLNYAIAAHFGRQGLMWGPNPTLPWGISPWSVQPALKIFVILVAISSVVAMVYAWRIRTRPMLGLALLFYNMAIVVLALWTLLTMTSPEEYMMQW